MDTNPGPVPRRDVRVENVRGLKKKRRPFEAVAEEDVMVVISFRVKKNIKLALRQLAAERQVEFPDLCRDHMELLL